jgi:hypothetical protein
MSTLRQAAILSISHLGRPPLLLIIACFVIPGRAGGAVFLRLFGMKRAKAADPQQIVQQF